MRFPRIQVLINFYVVSGQLWTKKFIANMIFMTLAGIARCSIAILLPVVIADAVLPEQFSSAMGISMMFSGLTNLTLGFAIGKQLFINACTFKTLNLVLSLEYKARVYQAQSHGRCWEAVHSNHCDNFHNTMYDY